MLRGAGWAMARGAGFALRLEAVPGGAPWRRGAAAGCDDASARRWRPVAAVGRASGKEFNPNPRLDLRVGGATEAVLQRN